VTRVRFAPSPTGYLHVGGARTVLYNRLFASSTAGTLILRSDDTDQERSTPEFAADILGSLEWLGIGWDEGIGVGGPHEPYQQSARLDRYRQVADELVAAGNAYYSFATQEQLEGFRNEARAAGTAPAYDGRYDPDPEEGAERVAAGEPATVRFRIPRPGVTEFEDVVRGTMTFDHTQVDDFVILRSDRTPTYHLASTVDDVDFGITHVIRGEDLLSSTPKHILLTEALGENPAIYAHLSLLMGPDGKKLSKRHGDTSIAAFRRSGYLPEALVNYLALLGWSPGEDETVVRIEEMIERFSLDAVSRNPAIFDEDKLEWLNGVYLRELTAEAFAERALPFLVAGLGRELDDAELAKYQAIAPHVQERAKRLTEVPDQVAFLFVDSVDYDEASWEKVMKGDEPGAALEAAAESLSAIGDWTTPEIETALRAVLERLGLSARKGLQPIRVAVSGSTVSPPLFESLEVLGREESLERIGTALDRMGATA
jgi:glutamyl-tRNA synthetase